MAQHMGVKFIALQVVLITFGIALFFGLATLKKKRAEEDIVRIEPRVVESFVVEKDETSLKADVKEAEAVCDFPEFVGLPAEGQDVMNALQNMSGRRYRILGPNSMASMDYIPDRINIHTDENGIVVKVDCG